MKREDRKKDRSNSTLSRRGFASSALAALGLAASRPAERIAVEPVSFHEADYYCGGERNHD